MQFSFRNIDGECMKLKHEPVGDIQPKYWFRDLKKSKTILVKRQQKIKSGSNKPKSDSFNHYGEYFAYLLAKKAGISSCPIELVSLHDTKNKYAKTKRLYLACSSENLTNPYEIMHVGEVILSKYLKYSKYNHMNRKNDFSLTKVKRAQVIEQDENDDIDFIIQGIKKETTRYERQIGIKSDNEIQEDIDRNVSSIIDQVVFDCVFGNNDRHSNNWGGVYNQENGTFSVYPAFDNERILGFCKSKDEMRTLMNSGKDISEYQDKEFFSRMGVYPIVSGISYSNMLDYLYEYYPEYAMKSSKKILDNIDEEYLDSLYDGLNGISNSSETLHEATESIELPEAYRIFGLKMFRDRIDYLRRLYDKRIDLINMNDIDEVLTM